MDIKEIMNTMTDLNIDDLLKIKTYAEGLMEKGRPIYNAEICVGVIKEIGDERNGKFKVKILKIRRKTAIAEIIERLDFGSRPKANGFAIGTSIKVPLSILRKGIQN